MSLFPIDLINWNCAKVVNIPRICIDCRYIGKRPSGIGEVVRALVDHAPSLAPDLEFVLLVNPQANLPLSNAANVEERSLRFAANGPVTMWGMPLFAPLDGIDLYHAPANILPAGLGVPCVTTIHDIMWLTHPHWCDPSAIGQIKRRFFAHGIRHALDRSDAIATVSEASREAIIAHRPDLSDRVVVTRSGVSKRFQPGEANPELLAEVGISSGERFILVVGQNAPYKNHEGALRAFAHAFADDAGIKLVVVQRRGPSNAPLRRLAKDIGIGDRVLFPTTMPEDRLVRLYSAAAALLHPSLCEGFGNPVAEAIACGCPVITSNRSAMPEVAGGAALLVDPTDPGAIARALKTVVKGGEAVDQMREDGRKRADELSWAGFANANIAIYRSVLDQG